jgi:hypothetical protein
VDLTGEGVEFCLVANGTIRFSRAAEVPQPQDQLAVADAVVTETRRTWMSYRVGDDAPAVPMALIMGDRRVSEYAAEPVADMLKVPVKVLQQHPCIDASGQNMDRLWPLAGLLLEPLVSNMATGGLINFAKPRQAPDLAARARQRRLAVAGLLIVALLGAWTLARHDLASLKDQAQALAKSRDELAPHYYRFWRDTYKLEHLKQWESVGVDWLKHATYLTTIAPPPDRAVLDSWNGTLDFGGVQFDGKTGRWSADKRMNISIEGEARDRETADAFREALTQNSIYTTSTAGADRTGGKRMPFGFTYRLRTKVGSPSQPVQAAASANSSGRESAASNAPAAPSSPAPVAALPPPPAAPPSASVDAEQP